MRSKESDKQRAVLKLQHDLLNGPLHCFGCHIKCSTDFCKSIAKYFSMYQVEKTTNCIKGKAIDLKRLIGTLY